MKYPNIQAIRRQLPYGSMTKIADDLGITVKKVSDFFNRGWHKNLSNEILSRSVEMIKSKNLDGDLITELDELSLTSNFPTMSIKKKKNNPGNPDDEIGDFTWDDIDDMDRGDLEDVVYGFDLDIDPEDYDYDYDGDTELMIEICDELGIEEESEEE